ncbi:MAG: CotH kinase family protein [Ignavibacteriaceae bacterium]|nr:CotH kinase family protein [Ignavibacteriaceae bacterium]
MMFKPLNILFLAATFLLSQATLMGQLTSSNLPIVVINTNGQTIQNTTKITADMGIISNPGGARNYLTDPFNHYNSKIGIELRGSSSQQFPKKPYAFETRDAAGNNNNVPLLGLPSENDWILNATYNDKTLMRDVLMYNLSNVAGRYASRSKYCEVILNGQYIGVYILMEKIKTDKNRVDIKKMTPEDITGDNLTGGYIIKIDKLDGEQVQGWQSPNLPYPGSPFKTFYQYHIPKPDDIVNAQKDYIKNFISNFENVMKGNNFENPLTGYPSIFDENSLADFYLFNEFAKNVDGFRLSTFMHKDRDSRNPKMIMGPIWDFNIALGNANYYGAAPPEGWQIDNLTTDTWFLQNDGFQVPFWWKKLRTGDRFAAKLKVRWEVLKNHALNKDRIFAVIDSLVTYLEESRIRNFQKWQILSQYVWPNPFVGHTYQAEISYLKNWISSRLAWMDTEIDLLYTGIQNESPSPNSFSISSYPNPLLSGSDLNLRIHSPGFAELKLTLYDVRGSIISEDVPQILNQGTHDLSFSLQNLNLSSGVYFLTAVYISENGNYLRETRKISIVK